MKSANTGRWQVVAIGLAVVWSALGCSTDEGGSEELPTLAITASPETAPPTLGDNVFGVQVNDAQGVGVVGASLTVVPWMPAMGHGASSPPVCKENGGGAWRCTEVRFTMPGTWEVRIKATTDTDAGQLTLTYELKK